MRFKQQNQNGTETCIVHDYRSFADSSHLTSKVNSHTFKVKTNKRLKLRPFGLCDAKLFSRKSFAPVTWAGLIMWENFCSSYRDIGS